MIDRLAELLAVKLIRWSEESHDEGEIVYNIALLITTVLIIGMTMAISWYFGTVLDSLLTLAFIAILRKCFGGRHLPSLDACVLFTVALAILVPRVPELSHSYHWFIALIALAAIYYLTAAYERKHSLYLFVFLFVVSLVWSYKVLTVCLVVQALSLIKSLERRQRHEKENLEVDH